MPLIYVEELKLNTEELSAEERLLVERLSFLQDEIQRAEKRLEVFLEMSVSQGRVAKGLNADE